MTVIVCRCKKCLNNKKGVCVANSILVEKTHCKDYCTAFWLSKHEVAAVHKVGGKFKQKKGVLK